MAEKKYLDSGGLTTLVSNIKSKVETITNQLDNKKATKDELASAESRITAAEKDIDAAEVLLQSISSKLGGISSGAEVNQNAFSNVKVGSTTVAADAKQDTLELVAGSNVTISADAATDKISISAKDTTYGEATTSAAGLMSATDKTNLNSAVSKLSGISSGAEVNQNAFSNVKVEMGDDSTTIVADTKTDTLTLVVGDNITIETDAANDKISISAKDTTYSVATTSAAGLMSATDKTNLNSAVSKLSGISSGAEVNQNAFSNVKVGSTTVAADAKQDTLELVAGTNITIDADVANDKISISTTAEVNQNAFSNVKVGSTTVAADAKQDTLELVAGTNITISADAATDKISISAKDTTYSEATTSAAGLMSATDKTNLNSAVSKLSGIAAGAEVNQNSFSNVKVGSTTVVADTKQDTLELVAGSNITISADTATDKISISAKDTTYNEATTSTAGLMSAADKIKLNAVDAISSEIEINPKTVGGQVLAYVGNGYYVSNVSTGSVVSTTATINNGYEACILSVTAGEKYVIQAVGGSSPRIWCFTNSSYEVIRKCEVASLNCSGTSISNNPAIIIVPQGATRLLLNNTKSSNYEFKVTKLIDGLDNGTARNPFIAHITGTASNAIAVTDPRFELTVGAELNIISDTNTSVNTLNVNGTGDIPFYYPSSTNTYQTFYVVKARPYKIFYNGYGWVISSPYVSYSNTSFCNIYPETATTRKSVSAYSSYPACNTIWLYNSSGWNDGSNGRIIIKFNIDVIDNDYICLYHYTNNSSTTAVGPTTAQYVRPLYFRGAPIKAGVIKAGDVVTLSKMSNDKNNSAKQYYDVLSIDRCNDNAWGTTSGNTSSLKISGESKTVSLSGHTHTKSQITDLTIPNGFSNVKVGSATVAADSPTDTVELVQGPAIVLDTDVANDKISISHDEEGPSSGYTSGNATTSISGSGGSGTIKIPQLTVNKYGHVTAAADENVTITMPTIPSSIKNPKALKFGSKTYDGSAEAEITAADLGLSSALKYHGTTTTAISDGSTTNPVVIGGSNHTATQGCVVAYGKKEFVWTGSAWEELGNEGNYKVVQTAVSSPSASGSATAFIDTISQDTNGKITVTKKNVSSSTQSAAGLMSAADKTKLDGIATGANKYTLPNATSSTLGGVKIGSNISVSSGTISLTKDNVTAALGYTPPTTNSTYANYSFGNGYATCTTAEATTAKVATYTNYSKQHGGIVAVKFTYAVPANSTLNINSKGAHDIYYNGAKIIAGVIGAGDTALFVYDSNTGYVLLSTQVVTKARLGAHKHAYTPAGTIGNATAGGSVSSTFTGTAHKHTFTGTAHKHTFTGTAATSGGPSGTTSVYSITGVGSLPSCTLPSTTVSYSNGELSITHNAGSFSAGSLPSRSEVTLASSNHTHSVTATGTIGNTTAGGSLDEVAATGTIGNTTAGGSVSSTFTGTAHNHSFTGTAGTATTIS